MGGFYGSSIWGIEYFFPLTLGVDEVIQQEDNGKFRLDGRNTLASSGNENKEGIEKRIKGHAEKPVAKKDLEGNMTVSRAWASSIVIQTGMSLLGLYQVLSAALPCMHILCHAKFAL